MTEELKKGKKYQKNEEEIILKAWRRGERTIEEIMEETGYPYKTVRKYIPIDMYD